MKHEEKTDQPKRGKNDQVDASTPAKLLFRGSIINALEMDQVNWIVCLLKKIFSGKEITTNECEGTFVSIGMEIRRGRGINLEQALTKVMLQRKSIPETIQWFALHYPMSDMGKRGFRGSRNKIHPNQRYCIIYTDRWNVKTLRTVDVIRCNRKWIYVFGHLRQDFRTLKRSKIEIINQTDDTIHYESSN